MQCAEPSQPPSPLPCLRSACPQEQDPDRRAAMHAIRDTRVDVCLYFIPPHRLRQVGLGGGALAAHVPHLYMRRQPAWATRMGGSLKNVGRSGTPGQQPSPCCLQTSVASRVYAGMPRLSIFFLCASFSG